MRATAFRTLAACGAALALGLAACGGMPTGVSSQISPEYRETVRAFYRGLASLEVGLLDDAQAAFERAAALAPDEPAIRANLAVVHVGFGNEAEAAGHIEAARGLAPDSAEVRFLEAQLAGFQGRFEEAVAGYRQVVELDPDHLRARYALAQELDRAGGDAEAAEAQAQLEAIRDRRPGNLAVLVQHARVAARRQDAPALTDTVERLQGMTGGWPDLAVTQLEGLAAAVDEGDLARAQRPAQLLRNVLVRLPAFREDQARVSASAEAIAEPLMRFLVLPSPPATASPRDESLAYVAEPIDPGVSDDQIVVAVVPGGEEAPMVVAANGQEARPLGAPAGGAGFPFPTGTGPVGPAPPSPDGVLALDWTGDYRMDLVLAGPGGVRLWLGDETDDGFAGEADDRFAELVAAPGDDPAVRGAYGVWAADTEMDGDLDIVFGATAGAPSVLRNNADGTWQRESPFPGVTALRDFGWGDFDVDGDPDAALLDGEGVVHLFENRQAGRFDPAESLELPAAAIALAVGDLDADGRLDLALLDAGGGLWRGSWDGAAWETAEIASWDGFPAGAAPGTHRLLLADLDNNGALDVLASGPSGTRLWLADEASRLEPLDAGVDAEIFAAWDLTGDGLLDLVGVDDGTPVRLTAQADAGYGWQQIRPRANTAAGDQRINAFGVGGEIEVRAGLLVQKQVLTGAPAHFGLGVQTQADVTRISWPNGVTQADFEFAANQVVAAEQRLKGSCPWLFAHDGSRMQFVTDFIWRSPLGLRINAQDTADIAFTEDRVLVRGDQLAAVDGEYDLRITADLWETHFFDHVSLLVVDHPPDTEVWVDERFARDPVPLETVVTGPARTVTRVWDDAGADVSELVAKRDNRYVATFDEGTHQGVAEPHYLELELDEATATWDAVTLLAYGWVYPTDSSINVALGQGKHPIPRGVAMEGRDAKGSWVVLHPDLGFPAGKLKTMVVDVPRLPDGTRPRRLRLRTNLEIYWDWIAQAPRLDPGLARETRLDPAVADLGYRGYSRTALLGPRGLELPDYEIGNHRPRWRDLVGFHTRFGDVRELLAGVDDRYVIMNAGDEMRLRFEAPVPPEAGWRRDYVLIGDGWVKDGDFNTTHAKTVGPLPSHDQPVYDPDVSAVLEDDPVYRRHEDDWLNWHTRYVAPDYFLRGLRRVEREPETPGGGKP